MNKYPDLQAVMISCEQRELARSLTIPQFNAIGIPVFVSISPCNPAGPQQNCIASVHALHHAYEEGKDCLFLEDDLDIDAELFTYFLERAIEADSVTYFYLHDKPGHMEAFYGADLTNTIMLKQPVRRDLYPVRQQRHMYGSQAVYIPHWFHKVFVKNGMFQATQGSFDVFLSRHVVTRNHQALVALPHPVQHRHDRTARVGMGSLGKFSESFGLPWFAEGENEPVTRNVTRYDFCAENHYALERLSPVWRALPWENKGTFFVPQTAIGVTPLGGTVAPVELLKNSINPLVVFDSRSIWEGSLSRYGSRQIITVGGNDASIPFGLHGFPHLRFADYGEKQDAIAEVGFVFATTKGFAESCRFLPELARTALAVSGGAGGDGHAAKLDVRRPTLVGTDAVRPTPNARPGDVLITANSRSAGVRLPGNNDGVVPPHQPNDNVVGGHSARGPLRDKRGGSVVDGKLHMAASATGLLYPRAKSWFGKYGMKSSLDSLEVMRGSDVIVSDSEFILMEAAALGKKTVMMDSAGMRAVQFDSVPLVDPEVIAQKILEVAL